MPNPLELAAGDLQITITETLGISHDGVAWLERGGLSVRGVAAPLSPARAHRGTDDLGAFSAVTLADAGPVVASLRAYDDLPLIVFRAEARANVEGDGPFEAPVAAWPHVHGVEGSPARAFGFQTSEFGFPTGSSGAFDRWPLMPHRPAALGLVLLVAPDGRAALFAPLDHFHEQIVGLPPAPGAGLALGWHGDVAAPPGFATELALWSGNGARDVLDRHGAVIRRRAGTARLGRYADALGSKVSYWTDNGAAYWYRTEPGHTVTSGLTATVEDLRERGLPLGAVQLDSWFYPHERLRPFDGPETVVPPSGMMRWEPRDDILPEGVAPLRSALSDPPLVAHCRHLSSATSYAEDFDLWVDGEQAHPVDSAPYERWLEQCRTWGVETFEHDWLVQCFMGVRDLRRVPGRAREWQEGIDRAAARRGITLQWCMATPADFFQTATLRQVTSIRTSGDFGYIVGPGVLWAWFLYVNALARALDLIPFKDVFRATTGPDARHPEVEALLSALSAGPVGIGDPLGHADPAVLRPAHRGDGLLVKPDVAVAALSRCFYRSAMGREAVVIGEATTTHEVGTWVYVVTLNTDPRATADVEMSLSDLGAAAPSGPVVVYDWRGRSMDRLEPGEGWSATLPPLGWDLRVIAPLVDEVALVGDPTLYATAGDARVGAVRRRGSEIVATILGAGEEVGLTGWRDGAPWSRSVSVPDRGWIDVVF